MWRAGRPAEPGRPPRPAQTLEREAAASRTSVPPPRGGQDIQQTLHRVFGGAIQARAAAGPPGLFLGDFNADGWEDLAVVARPSPGRLEAINDELAPWIIRDALSPTPSSPSGSPTLNAVLPGDVLLAIIHGYGPDGWRSPEARHGFLLRHAVGEQMRSRPASEVVVVTEPGARAVGHVITGRLRGRTGFLYWSGSRYLWRSL